MLVHDTITSCCPSIVYLQETKLQHVSPFKLRSFLPASFQDHVVTPSVGAAGGILVTWDTACVQGHVIDTHRYHVTLKMSSTSTANSFLVTVVYAPCLHDERPAFLKQSTTLQQTQILLGLSWGISTCIPLHMRNLVAASIGTTWTCSTHGSEIKGLMIFRLTTDCLPGIIRGPLPLLPDLIECW